METGSKKVLAIIPALNEAETVAAVIAEIHSVVNCDVLVIDDGSTDATVVIARNAGATVVSHPFNLGVGAAIRTGLLYADRLDYSVVVQIDADGQHDVNSAIDLIEPALSGNADLILGSRFASGYQVSGLRALGMRLSQIRQADSERLDRTLLGRSLGHIPLNISPTPSKRYSSQMTWVSGSRSGLSPCTHAWVARLLRDGSGVAI